MPESATFEFGPYRLDAAKSVLWRSGALVPLTPKALALLHALLEAGGDVVSKAELMSRVWPDTAVAEANLSVTVAALRKALDDRPDGRSYIETVPRRGYRFDGPLRAVGSRPRLALAVLPFVCLGDGIEPHLGFGLADALTGRLTEMEGLLVRPTAAVAHYTRASKPPRVAAVELGVDAVVTGTIQRDGGRVRISVQVVMRPEALSPWADSFEADWTSLFTVQDVLAERVARALALRLTPGAPPRSRHTPGSEAYDSYLRGRYFWARADPESLGRAFAFFGEAATADPRWAAPVSGLADCHLLLGMAGLTPPPDACVLARECAEQALALDPDHADAHVARALAGLFRDWDWDGARSALERAVSLGPRSAGVHLWQGFFLAASGATGPALRAIARGREIDPLSNLASALRCLVHEYAGEPESALAVARRAVELRPDHFLPHRCLGVASVRLGRARAGVKALRRAVELTLGGPGMRCLLAWGLVQAGEAAEARRELADLDASTAATFVSPAQRAAVLLALGETGPALDRLEEAAESKDPAVVYVGMEPLYAGLRGQARFEALLRRIHFPGRT